MVNKWQWWMAGTCMTLVVGTAQADSLEAQRDRYQQIKQAWDSNQMDRVEQLMPGLRDYPLYPYLEYRWLTQNLQNETSLAVRQFIQRYPTLPPVRTLDSRFINELARRQDWKGLLSFSPQEPGPVAARCNWYYAKWATGQQEVAWHGAKDIWLRGTALPAACNNLFNVWQAAGQQTADATLERIRLAMKVGNGSLVDALAKQLPDDYKTIGQAIIQLQNDPDSVENFAAKVGPTDFTRQLTSFAFARLARQSPEDARAMIPTLTRLQKMSDREAQDLKETVVWRIIGTDVTSEQARWRDSVIMDSESVSLIERRIRLALANNDLRGLNTWLARLPVEAKEKEEWQYWQADLLLSQGRKDEADAILRRLMRERGFYPMVAAQRLGVAYPLRIDPVPAISAEVIQDATLARIRELMHWGMDNLARSEWVSLLAGKTSLQQQALAGYALKHDWWDLSVQATITGKLWNNLTERFPLAWRDEFTQYTRNKAIPESYAMAIARQESAWDPKARSPVGASGLMQLMPATAAQTVKMFSIPGYINKSQLLDPHTNIEIGTAYLDYLYRQFGNNRIFSSAAYNAGPGRVRSWLKASDGRLDPVAFIETIPFPETRLYVKNVLAYNVYYRHFMKQSDKLFSADEWQRHY
ncbi:soluble lytic murein transglycosylase [Izhakiella capsodis]|uniref:peptidoglycan lytic exotransglycosylase n=1 Tax=Izhakiella capsodis TaxID=1367852 RepID=A0A1I4WZD2_9GAMM|nr:murein transglycosylase [Izhakiella capsodis]SFN18927.1 soluble lytic murein transglycosylase [Izhakiella capsodis]